MNTVISRKPFNRFAFAALRRLTFTLVIAASATAFVGAMPAAARTHGAILVDGDTGNVMRADNADVQNHPASLTKIMTLYLLFDALEKGRVHLADSLKSRLMRRASRRRSSA